MESGERTQACTRPMVDSFAGLIGDPVLRLKFLKAVAPPANRPARRKRRRAVLTLALPAVAVLLIWAGWRSGEKEVARAAPAPVTRPAQPPAAPPAAAAEASVWLVDKPADSEIYSNGLRIDNRFAVANRPRSYRVFPVKGPAGSGGVVRTDPAGIVFHATESRQAPFEAEQNGLLKRIGQSLLEYVREKRAYHFVIDRFGRVYRVVAESDAANHAGYSVWSDGKWQYINLNDSFLGVSFEAETHPGQAEASITPAQERAGAMLIETLRSRYRIPAGNCVTHAQVSVNPSNMRVGYHVDWASGFPFERLGLPDNYGQALPALAEFGFEYDPAFLRWAGTRLYAGVASAEEALKQRAAGEGAPVARMRRRLRADYRARLEAIRRAGAAEESN